MKTHIKNLLLLLLLLAAPAAVQAQNAYSTNADGSIYTYSTNADGSANIVAYAGPPWVVTIPTNINGLTVTSIGYEAFASAHNLTSVTIPNSVTSIGLAAFYNCTNLTSVTIPISVISIGEAAFNFCKKLTSVTIPNSVTNIGVAAFEYCYSLTEIIVDTNNPAYCSLNGMLFDKSQATLIDYPCGLVGGSYTIPSSVTSIGDYAFDSCTSLTSVTIPNSVTSIGVAAFDGSGITSVTIPASVTNIGTWAFAYCGLTSVTIPNNVTSIGDYAFYNCHSLTSAAIPNRVTSIGNFAFVNCTSLTSVAIPASVTSIGYEAFGYCTSLTGIYFQGNSPSPTNDGSIFLQDPATVYYLPGTTGWGATFDGRPTAPWFLPNPLILDHSAGFGVQPGGFGFTLSWATNVSLLVEAATNLAHPVWLPVSTNPLTNGSSYFSDPQWTNYPSRFYRAAYAFTVGGTLTGLPAGDTVTLQNNGSDNLTLSNNGPFTFPTALTNGQSYSVTYKATTSRFGAYTFFTNGSGTISGTNVTNVAVTFTPVYTGYLHEDMYNAAVADGTANGGVPGVMQTPYGGLFRVTAPGYNSVNVALLYSGQGGCVFTVTVGSTSCSSTSFTNGAPVIQFGNAVICVGDTYGY